MYQGKVTVLSKYLKIQCLIGLFTGKKVESMAQTHI